MPSKKLQELEAGMTLAADVMNLDGQILFRSGVLLGEHQIEVLQMWGVPNVEIVGKEEDADIVNLNEYPTAIVERAEELMNLRFKLVKSTHPVVETAKKFFVCHKAKELMKSGNSH